MNRLVGVMALTACHVATVASGPIDYPARCRAIAEDIEAIAPQHPQLVAFAAHTALTRSCTIDYAYHTHKPAPRGGWSSQVPAPDPDGIWLFVDVWDPNDPRETMREIHTQPMMGWTWHLGAREVTFLIREGERTTQLVDRIEAILAARGATRR
jgi:hypothetical protein